MMRFGLFIVILILVFAPLVWLQAEDEGSAQVLAGRSPEPLVAAGVPAVPGPVTGIFRSPDSPPSTLFFERRLEAPPVLGVPRRPKICPAQASPYEPGLGAEVDLCDVGYEISRMSPCTSAEDCPAHELWSSELGAPGLQPARPDRVLRIPRPSRAAPSPGDER